VYGALFQAVSDVVTALFQKSSELQLHFLEVVSENLEFKCMYEDELVQLTESKLSLWLRFSPPHDINLLNAIIVFDQSDETHVTFILL